MCLQLSEVFVLVTAVSCYLHVQVVAGTPPRLDTTYALTRTQNSSQVFLRVAARSVTGPSLTFALQTDQANCIFEVKGNYSGEVLQAAGTYGSQALGVSVRRAGQRGDGVPAGGAELLTVAWRANAEENLRIVTPRATISLASGRESTEGGWFWKLWVRDSDVDGEAPAGASTPPHPDEGGAQAGSGVLVRVFPAAPGTNGWGVSANASLGGDWRRLLTLSFIAHNERSWQVSLEIPLLSVAFECESVWSEGEQHWQVTVGVNSSASGASLKLVHLELKEQEDEAKHAEDNGEAGDLWGSRNTDGYEFCHRPGIFVEEKWREQSGHEENRPDACSKGRAEAESGSLPSGATHQIRQSIASSVLNYSSNMTTFPSDDGEHTVWIHQRSHLAFCPRLSWTLNQVFRFRPDWSGWEYVVMGWDWGGMVVRGEWGVSLLQWYQKTFAFSFDKGAPLPSTHVVLDFRDRRSYKVWLRWPVLAAALAASVTVDHDRHALLVEEVDEFLGEGAAVELARVEAQHSPAGLTLTASFSAGRIRELHADAILALERNVCGEVSLANTFGEFLRRLLGQPPGRLWDRLLLEIRHLLLGSGSQTNFHHLWEALEEEIGTAGGAWDLWGLAWAGLERAGLVEVRGEGQLKVFVPVAWLGLAQRVLTWAGGAANGRCDGGELVECLLEVVAEGLLGRGGHHHQPATA
ncbi:uncharacterized protein LOC127009823 [Eriocheir sinensis]|uniref:uncharacterized protein LOC127009823 n=1 Tax=Eriocheir sinensis TaxID=95602 RepID=UPI0021C6209A|nr:uncharacterized protein LOC127009823 [Eriocheir sinensis]